MKNESDAIRFLYNFPTSPESYTHSEKHNIALYVNIVAMYCLSSALINVVDIKDIIEKAKSSTESILPIMFDKPEYKLSEGAKSVAKSYAESYINKLQEAMRCVNPGMEIILDDNKD